MGSQVNETPSSAGDEDSGHEDQLSDHLGRNLTLRFADLDDDGIVSNNSDHNFDSEQNGAQIRSTNPIESHPTSTTTIRNPTAASTWNDDTIDAKTPRRSGYRVTFEIISAKTVGPERSTSKKFIVYTILVKRSPGLETHPGVIERRYSDFLALYQALKKRFPVLMTDFPFPKKMLVGNFNAEVITERSVAFQHLLAYCLSVPELRTTTEFADFLYKHETREAQRHMRLKQFDDTVNLLENVYFIQEKLYIHSGEVNLRVFKTICVIVACQNALNNVQDAQEYAEKAMQMISSSCPAYEPCSLLVPLLTLAVRLTTTLGKETRHLQVMLDELKEKRKINTAKQPTLLELVMQKNFLSN